MPQPKKGPRLASSPAHERLMLANMATSLYEHGQIKTTLPKAKRLRPLAERLITFAKRGDLNSRRRVLRIVRNKSVVHKLFTEIAQQMEQREGGYTRIIKIAPRQGDSAPMAVIELVTESVSARKAAVKEAEAAAKSAAKLPEDTGKLTKPRKVLRPGLKLLQQKRQMPRCPIKPAKLQAQSRRLRSPLLKRLIKLTMQLRRKLLPKNRLPRNLRPKRQLPRRSLLQSLRLKRMRKNLMLAARLIRRTINKSLLWPDVIKPV